MEEFVIEGGVPLRGEVTPAGNKNAALPVLAACLLTPETCEIRNVPRIRDVAGMIDLLKSLGAEVEDVHATTVRITCRDIRVSEPDASLVGRLRGSVLLLGALAKTGKRRRRNRLWKSESGCRHSARTESRPKWMREKTHHAH